jgi:hypothetical protein
MQNIIQKGGIFVSLASYKKYVLAACQREKKTVAELFIIFSSILIVQIRHLVTIGLPLENFWRQLAC